MLIITVIREKMEKWWL